MPNVSIVPEGWKVEPLSSCVDVLDSRRKPVNWKERESRIGPIPYYGATGQVGWIDDFLFDEELVLLGEDGAPFLDKSKPIAYIIDGKSWVNNHAHVLRARSEVTSNRYIKHYLDSFDFSGYVQGSTRDKLTQRAMNAIPVSLAPRPLQEKLVRVIDAAGAKRSSAKAHLASARRAVERFRQAVLAAACSGRLEAEESQEWQSVAASELFKWSSGKGLTSKQLVPGDIPVYGGNGISGYHNQALISQPTIVIGRVGALCGNVYLTKGPAWVTDNAIFGKQMSERVLPEWAALVFQSAKLNSLSGGSSQPFVNQTILNAVEVPVPSLDRQRQIIRRVDRLLALADGLEQRIERATHRIDRTSQAVLAKAFRGELMTLESTRKTGD